MSSADTQGQRENLDHAITTQEKLRGLVDAATRRSYLENVPWNRKIVELWEASK